MSHKVWLIFWTTFSLILMEILDTGSMVGHFQRYYFSYFSNVPWLNGLQVPWIRLYLKKILCGSTKLLFLERRQKIFEFALFKMLEWISKSVTSKFSSFCSGIIVSKSYSFELLSKWIQHLSSILESSTYSTIEIWISNRISILIVLFYSI